MDAFADKRRVGRRGTDVPSVFAVQKAVERLVRKQWGGWSDPDQQDLQQLVMVKYFRAFGRDRLPDGSDGQPAVPVNWLIKVIRNAGVDFHRQQEARPADLIDFQASEDPGLERVMLAVNPQQGPSTAVAGRVDTQRVVGPALEALGSAYPRDLKLVLWRFAEDRDLRWIGDQLELTPDSTRKAVQRAVTRLRDLVNTMPGGTSD